MARKLAWMLVSFPFILGDLGMPVYSAPAETKVGQRVVYLAGDLADEDLIAFTANVAASSEPSIALIDGPRCSKPLRAFFADNPPKSIVAVGRFPEGIADLERRLAIHTKSALAWKRGPPVELWKTWFPRAEQVVVCPAEPRRLLLQAACLAGTLKSPLWVAHGPEDAKELRDMLGQWQARRVLAVGNVAYDLPGVNVVKLADEEAVAALHHRHLNDKNVQTLVVANPGDTKKELGGMSVVAPLVALQQHGALLLTNDEGDNTAAVVKEALRQPRLKAAENLVLVADLVAIPMERRNNPVAGKDTFIEMEPLTPTGDEPFTFATGRLFHEDPGMIALILARQQQMKEQPPQATRRALVVSNPGGGLSLLEMFSHNTVQELRNRGYQTTALYAHDVTKEDVRRLLPKQDIFLWEGHHSTLVKDYKFPEWTEPLPPSLIFLQSCLALTDVKTHPVLERGAVAVVGSSTRIYSATGGAFSLAYFNALLYDNRSLGGSLRQAKNFLLAYSLLKEKRLGKEAKLTGANLRSAWAFSLWGDPTLQLPMPTAPAEALPAVSHEVRGNTITLALPDATYEKVKTAKYEAQLRPNTYLAGLLTQSENDDKKQMVPFLFTEVAFPHAANHQKPRLTSKVPDSHWVFCWDQRRQVGYLLVAPRAKDTHELRFHVEWEPVVTEAGVNGSTGQ